MCLGLDRRFGASSSALAALLAGVLVPGALFAQDLPPVRGFVTDRFVNAIRVFDPATDTHTADILVGNTPVDQPAPSYDGELVFVGNFNSNNISVINVRTQKVVSVINNIVSPRALLASPNFAHMYVLRGKTITVIDVFKAVATPASAIVQNVSLDSIFTFGVQPNAAEALAFSSDGKHLYVAASAFVSSGASQLRMYVFNAETLATAGSAAYIKSFPLTIPSEGAGFVFVTSRPGGTVVYAGAGGFFSSVVNVIETSNHTIQKTVTLGFAFLRAFKSRPDGAFIYGQAQVAGGVLDGPVLEFDPSSLALVRRISVEPGMAPGAGGLDVMQNNQTIYAAFNTFPREVARISLPTGAVVNRIMFPDADSFVGMALTVPRTGPVIDTTPPGQIDLAIATTPVTASSITFSWIAVGDNASSGTASAYDLRFATFPIISEAVFGAAQRASAPPPLPAGSTERFTLGGLQSDVTYYANIRAIDSAGNVGPLSNSPLAKTIDVIAPASITTLRIGRSFASSVTLTWTSVGDNETAGRAVRYDVRVTTDVTGGFNLSRSTPVSQTLIPAPAGSTETYTVDALQGDSTYFFTVRAIDEAGNTAPLSNVVSTKTIDVLAPGAISDLAASAVFGTSVTLTWTATGDNGLVGQASRYDLRYTTADISQGFPLAASVLVPGVSRPGIAGSRERFTVIGLTSKVTYHFAIRAFDEVGQVGAWSNVFKASTLDIIPPGVISDLSIDGVFGSSISLRWTAVGDDGALGTATAYDLRYATHSLATGGLFASATRAQAGPPNPSGTTEQITITGLQSDTTYFVSIRAIDAVGNAGGLSNNPSALTLDTIPPTPITDLSAAAVFGTSVTLTWTASGDNGATGRARSYELRFSTTVFPLDFAAASRLGGLPAPQAAGFRERFTVEGLDSDTTFYFALLAVDEASNASPPSNVATATTLDIIPPSPITDLIARTGEHTGEVSLTWTAVGDNGTAGTAAGYLLKASSMAITLENFEAAPSAGQPPTPGPPGSRENVELAGLIPGATVFFAIEAVDKAGNRGPISNPASAIVHVDTVPPSAITDLRAEVSGALSVNLTWTSPTDDDTARLPGRYDLRFSTIPLDSESAFAVATALPSTPPAGGGTRQTLAVTGLVADVPLFFAVKTFDAEGNPSLISNLAAAVVPDTIAVVSILGPGVVAAGSTFEMAVFATDALGLPVPGVPITLTLVSGSSRIESSVGVTSVTGQAIFHVAAAQITETSVFSAQAAGLPPTSDAVTVISGLVTTPSDFPTVPVVLAAQGLDRASLSAQWISDDPVAGIKGHKVSVGSSGDLSIGMWADITPQSQPLPFGDIVASGSRLYALGLSAQMAEATRDGDLAWTPAAPPPIPVVQKGSSALIGNRIYSVSHDGQTQVAFLNPVTRLIDGWRTTSPVPFGGGRVGYRVASIGNTLYVIGGSKVLLDEPTPEVYFATVKPDGTIPSTGQSGSWARTTDLPQAGSHQGVVALGRFLYVVGGQVAGSHVSTAAYVAVPNPDGSIPGFGRFGSWTEVTNLPLARTNHTLETDGTFLFVVGGTDRTLGGQPFSVAGVKSLPVFRVRLGPDGQLPVAGNLDSWSAITPVPRDSGSAISRSLGGRLYSFSEFGNRVHMVDLLSNGTLSGWQPLSSESAHTAVAWIYGAPTGGFALATLADRTGAKTVYMLGGRNFKSRPGFSEALNVQSQIALSMDDPPHQGTLSWTGMGALPEPRADAAAVGSAGRIYLLGGTGPDGRRVDTVFVAGESAFGWKTAGKLPFPNSDLVALIVGKRLYAIGGSAPDSGGIYSAPISGADATLGAFRFETSLFGLKVYPRFQALAVGNRIYTADAEGAVFSVVLGDDGGVAKVDREPFFPVSEAGSIGLVTAGRRLFVIGTNIGVWASDLGPDGRLSAWFPAGSFPKGHPDLYVIQVADMLYALAPTRESPTRAFVTRINLAGEDIQPYTPQLDSQLSLTNLALGSGLKYRFAVRSQSNSGAWSEIGVSPPLTIPAPPVTPHTSLLLGPPNVQLGVLFISSATPLAVHAGPGIVSVSVSVDGRPLPVGPDQVFHITTDGSHLLEFFGLSTSGVVEPVHQTAILVNNEGPEVAITSPTPFQILEGPTLSVEGAAFEPVTSLSAVEVSTDGGATLQPATIEAFDANRVARWRGSIALPFDNVVTTFVARGRNSLDNFGFAAVPIAIFNKPFPAGLQLDVEPRINLPGETIEVTVALFDPFGRPLGNRNFKASVSARFQADVVKLQGPKDRLTVGPPIRSVDTVFERQFAIQDASGVIRNRVTLPGLSVDQLNQIALDRTKAQVEREADEMIAARRARIQADAERLAKDLFETTFLSESAIRSRVQSFVDAESARLQADVAAFAQPRFDHLFPTISTQVFHELGLKEFQAIQLTITISTVQALLPYALPGSLVATTTVLSIPQSIALTGLPTQDNGRAPSALSFGDLRTSSGWGQPARPSDTLSFAAARRQTLATNPQLYAQDPDLRRTVIGGYRQIVEPLVPMPFT